MNATTRLNQQTTTLVTVISAADAHLCDGAGTTKWYTICEDHDTTCGHPTRRLAERFSASPVDWCDNCREAQP
jgi:hypothetical protein